MITCDLLVLGGGIAGCSAALRAAELGADVVLALKDPLGISNTRFAQGGIIGLAPPEAGDSPELLAADIEAAGAGLCRPEAVALLADQGPALCRNFLWKSLGVPFDHTGDLDPEPTAEAAHSARRIYHVKDATGKAIQEALSGKVVRPPAHPGAGGAHHGGPAHGAPPQPRPRGGLRTHPGVRRLPAGSGRPGGHGHCQAHRAGHRRAGLPAPAHQQPRLRHRRRAGRGVPGQRPDRQLRVRAVPPHHPVRAGQAQDPAHRGPARRGGAPGEPRTGSASWPSTPRRAWNWRPGTW